MTENEQLLENLIENCTADSAKAFFRRKNVHFKAQSEELENSDSEKFSNLWKIGRLDFEADNIVFAFAEVKAELSERSCRKAQFEAARKILRATIRRKQRRRHLVHPRIGALRRQHGCH